MANQDISRWLQQTRKHYAAARLQQARVLLDSDPNEGGIAFVEQRRRALVDAIGPKGAPAQGFTIRQPLDGSGNEPPVLQAGDEIASLSATFNGDTTVDVLPLSIGSGSFYVGGLRLDMDQAESVAFQRDFLQEVGGTDLMPAFTADFRNLYYLRVWEQGVSSVEDEEAREVMLRAGRDSGFRIRRMRRVEVLGLPAGITTCNDAWTNLLSNRLHLANATFDERNNELRSLGMLQLVFSGGEAADACSPPPQDDPLGKRYLGAENQTLRILLTSDNTYVWALDNATPLFKVQIDNLGDPSKGVKVTILNPPSDERSMPFAGRVVEIIPFGGLLDGGDLTGADPLFRKVTDEVGVFTRISGPYDPVKHTFALELDATITGKLQHLVHVWDPKHHPFATELNAPDNGRDQRFFYMRLWHDAATAADVEIQTSKDPKGAPLGDTGIVPVFRHDGQAGDYWVATLRVDSPDRIQPFDLESPDGMPPAGPRRFYAPLALIAGEAAGSPGLTRITQVEDCRPRIRPLSDRGCATLIVGDGIHSFGDFTSIQDALNALPVEGGLVAVRPGVYNGPITVKGSNVSLEGCGDATVVQTLGTSEGSALLTITGASNAHVSGFKLQAVGERALRVIGRSSGVDVGSMHLVGGTFDNNGAFTQFGTADFGLVEIADKSSGVTLHDSVLEPNRQPGVVLGRTSAGAASDVTLTRLNILGSLSLENNDVSPLVHVDGQSTDVVLSDSALEPRGQHGVFVSFGASHILLDRLTFAVHAQQGSAGGPSRVVTRARPAVMVSSVLNADFTLRRSRIVVDDTQTDHAAVAVGGTGIIVDQNHIQALGTAGALSHAWGGIQVLSESQGIRVTGNEIVGGYGHGITLGSVLWVNQQNPHEFLNNFNFQGPGAGQTETSIGGSSVVNGRVTDLIINSPFTSLRTHYVPAPVLLASADVADILIADNRIEGMSTNGISALTVLGLPNGFLPEIQGIRIERNTITGNLVNLITNVHPSTPLPLTSSRSFLRIQLPRIPFGGIVLATATEAHIRDNAIISNGISRATGVLPINGIFILNGDSIDIDGNRILHNGSRAPANSPNTFVRVGPRSGITVLLCGTSTASNPTSTIPSLVDFLTNFTNNPDNGGVSLRVTNNTVNHPEGRALHAIATGPVLIEGNYLASQGNAGGDATSEQFQVGDLVYVQNLGGPWERFELDARSSDAFQNFTMPIHAMPVLLNQINDSPYRYVGDGGGVLFNNNQTVLDWTVQRSPTVAGAPLAFFPIALVTLDHLGVLGNQMTLQIDGVPANLPSPLPPDEDVSEPVLSHLLALGLTLNIELNRFSENVKSVFLSIMARADLMNSTAFNQSTHDIFSIRQVRQQDFLNVINNQVLFLRTPAISDTESLRAELKNLFGLLFPIQ
jgi:hypothetical protein